uniref:Lysophosphatidylcholine acyltransferase 4 n=1 Tax=Poecilia reticulata TaxID=8081 RepID=A0A3P9NWE2_POERE
MEKGDCCTATQEYPHPFIFEVKLTRAQRIRGLILGSVLVPVRVTLAALFFLIMWPIARLRLAGLSEEERARPVTGWRRWLFHPIILLLSRAVFFSLGFPWVRVKGRRADLKEAPVLVVAPHSGFLDMLVLCPTQLATVVSRYENTKLPVIGALLEFNQSVLVSRKDPESRKMAVAKLIERLTSKGYWPQMLMFPEGTTTNGRALIKFKPGRCPQREQTENYLPVYNPSEEEKKNPSLYADNVQKLMAKALGVPATDHVMEGRVPVSKLGGLSLPLEPPGRVTLLEAHEIKVALAKMIDRCRSGAQGSKASADELTSILSLKDKQMAVSICGLYSKDETVDLKQLYFSVSALSDFTNFKALLHSAFTLFDQESKGSLSEEELSDLMGAMLGIPQHNTGDLYTKASSQGMLTEENLLRVLTTHPTYQKVVNDYLQPEEAGPQPSPTAAAAANGKAVNSNGVTHGANGFQQHNKKLE